MFQFQLTKTFVKESLQVTPIIMDGKPAFLAQELGEQFGYADLSNSIRTSSGFIKDKDYIVLDGEKLRQLKNIFNSVGNTNAVNSGSNTTPVGANAKSTVLITESGFYGLAFRSDKPECVRFRLWVTDEVLPSIRRTGGYAAAGLGTGKGKITLAKLAREWRAAQSMVKASGVRGPAMLVQSARLVGETLGVNPYDVMGIPEPDITAPQPSLTGSHRNPLAERIFEILSDEIVITGDDNFIPTRDIMGRLTDYGIKESKSATMVVAVFMKNAGAAKRRILLRNAKARGYQGCDWVAPVDSDDSGSNN